MVSVLDSGANGPGSGPCRTSHFRTIHRRKMTLVLSVS